MKRVYVAGPYSSDNVIGVLSNMRKGIDACVVLIRHGFAPFCPWLDFQYGLVASLSLEDFQGISMAWLEGADAVFLLHGWQDSKGATAERERAAELGILVFSDWGDLISWRDDNE